MSTETRIENLLALLRRTLAYVPTQQLTTPEGCDAGYIERHRLRVEIETELEKRADTDAA